MLHSLQNYLSFESYIVCNANIKIILRPINVWIVIFYLPSGNIVGKFLDNVFPPSSNQLEKTVIEDYTNGRVEKISPYHKDKDGFIKECVEIHNELRKLHGSPPLVLSRDLCDYANSWAHVRKSYFAVYT